MSMLIDPFCNRDCVCLFSLFEHPLRQEEKEIDFVNVSRIPLSLAVLLDPLVFVRAHRSDKQISSLTAFFAAGSSRYLHVSKWESC